MKILYSSEDVRNTVIDLFSNSGKRRIAIVAFVGTGAEAYGCGPPVVRRKIAILVKSEKSLLVMVADTNRVT